MPHWMPAILLCVFVTHLPLFAWQYHRTRELRYAATTLTFVLLVTSYALRVFAPEWDWHDRPLHQQVRVVAWLAASVSISLLMLHHLSSRAASRR